MLKNKRVHISVDTTLAVFFDEIDTVFWHCKKMNKSNFLSLHITFTIFDLLLGWQMRILCFL